MTHTLISRRAAFNIDDATEIAALVASEWAQRVDMLIAANNPGPRIIAEPWIDAIPPDELLEIVCPEIPPPRPITHTAPIGALTLWREELRRGVRTRFDLDVLWNAACREASGIDARRDGLSLTASDWFASAEQVIVNAAANKRRGHLRRAA